MSSLLVNGPTVDIMVSTVEFPQASTAITRETQRTWVTAVFAVAASIGLMFAAAPGSVSPVAYWIVSSIALTTVLVAFVAGLHAWDRWLAGAQAAGVVAR